MKPTGWSGEKFAVLYMPLSMEPRLWVPTCTVDWVETFMGLHEEVFTSWDLAGGPHQWRSSPLKPLEASTSGDLPGGLHWWPEAFSIPGCLRGSLRGSWKALRTVYVTVQQGLHSILIKFDEILLYCEKPTLSLDHPVDTWRKAYGWWRRRCFVNNFA